MRFLIFLLAFSFLLSSCATQKGRLESEDPKRLNALIPNSEVLENSLSGFALYDPATDEWLYQYQSDKLFIPASNAKILTLYSCLQVLGDSTVTAAYVTRGDSLLVWGLGDPAFLHPYFPQNPRWMELLTDPDYRLFISREHFTGNRYGPGWAWEDFGFRFQAERSSFPLYGNTVFFKRDPESGEVRVRPAYFQDYTVGSRIEGGSDWNVLRDELSNMFESRLGEFYTRTDERRVPFAMIDYQLTRVLADTFGRAVQIIYGRDEIPEQADILPGMPLDTLYARLMKQSDNFVAEQLVLQMSYHLFGTLDADRTVKYLSDSLFEFTNEEMRWIDGSGLSRYNLLSPRLLVQTLEQIYEQKGLGFIRDIFPAGGESGTIRRFYSHADGPYLWAKTGTMTNNHNLSGFIETDSGRMLIFSFMNNHFLGNNRLWKEEMEKILLYIKRNY